MPRALLLAILLILPVSASATFSIAAVDPETAEAAVAVTTRVPFVGRPMQ